ncbi:hypothetical protein IQ63_24690 [Streptomyces acidiscabies]|uniref:Peptidase M10 metallopeptidase domain-containing protein n=1 Tax=Streptomyces acidiscabies TaxID=42234 RepID=A0A0L0K316_9ACTN|nr:hypothetical protein IQ63_24690 [Streptomyces acidiscabies]
MNVVTMVALATATATALLLTNSAHMRRVPAAACVAGESESRSRSAVDDSEIRFTESTKYDEARTHAAKVWQSSSGTLSKIKVRADSATTVNDLEWRDYDRADGRAAYYHYRGGVAETDYIYLNKRVLDSREHGTRDYRRATAAHELGHALGLCHKSGRVLSLMWTSVDPVITAPTDTDQANYRRLWG